MSSLPQATEPVSLMANAGANTIPAWLPLVFCISGFSALVYQVVWQRVLFTSFGVNVESVTVVVTAFLAGLGLGSLAGGGWQEELGISFCCSGSPNA